MLRNSTERIEMVFQNLPHRCLKAIPYLGMIRIYKRSGLDGVPTDLVIRLSARDCDRSNSSHK